MVGKHSRTWRRSWFGCVPVDSFLRWVPRASKSRGNCGLYDPLKQQETGILLAGGSFGYSTAAAVVQDDGHLGQDQLSFNELAARIRRCGSARNVDECRRVHDHVLSSGNQNHTFLGNLLVEMYGKCNSLGDARAVFDGIVNKNVFSWTLIISAYALNGHCREAIGLYWQMQLDGATPDKFVLSSILSACSSVGAFAEGKAIHESIIHSSLPQDTVVDNSLVTMYAKCGSVEDARRTFDRMQRRDVVSWNAIIATYAQHEKGSEALKLFWQMHQEGVKPDLPTLTCVLDACAGEAAYREGKSIHEHFIACGFDPDILIGNTLINMYGKCGRLAEARSVLDGMPCKDVVSWTIMVAAYTQNGHHLESFKLLQAMDLEGVKADTITFISLLDSCANLQDLEQGKLLHRRILADGIELSLVDCLVSMYGKTGSLEDAKVVFDKAYQRNVSSWNAMIGAYAKQGRLQEALWLFRSMDLEGTKPDKITFYAVFDVCASLQALKQAKIIHESSGIESDVGFETAVVNLYSKIGSFGDAKNMFERMLQRDVVSWNAIISACNQHSRHAESVLMFRRMDLEGFKADGITLANVLDACSSLVNLRLGEFIHERIIAGGLDSDNVLENTLINMYGKCGSLEDARRVFDKMRWRCVVAWTAMITAYAQQGHGLEALELFQKMDLEGISADKVTFSLILDVCANLAALAQGRIFHASIAGTKLELDIVVENTLVNMYGKCGRLNEARSVFEQMPCKDIVSWTSIIAAYAQQGCAKEALELFRQMQQEGLKVDTVTFVKVISGCSHAGLLKDARSCFLSMIGDYGITPVLDHFACILDLLSRVGQVGDAEDLIDNMPVEPDYVSWMTLLNASKVHNDTKRGVRAAEKVLELDPRSGASYVLLSHIHAGAGKWEVAAKLRSSMADACGKKLPGLSWIEIKDRVHEFASGDESHPQKEQIHAELQRLSREMKEAGYVPDTKVVLRDVEEEEKEQLLCYHSEKLAMAFGLVSTPSGTPLRIVKNLRVCTDCHTATKLISKLTGRKITVRDATRFHEFEDGLCSCKDYW